MSVRLDGADGFIPCLAKIMYILIRCRCTEVHRNANSTVDRSASKIADLNLALPVPFFHSEPRIGFDSSDCGNKQVVDHFRNSGI